MTLGLVTPLLCTSPSVGDFSYRWLSVQRNLKNKNKEGERQPSIENDEREKIPWCINCATNCLKWWISRQQFMRPNWKCYRIMGIMATDYKMLGSRGMGQVRAVSVIWPWKGGGGDTRQNSHEDWAGRGVGRWIEQPSIFMSAVKDGQMWIVIFCSLGRRPTAIVWLEEDEKWKIWVIYCQHNFIFDAGKLNCCGCLQIATSFCGLPF